MRLQFDPSLPVHMARTPPAWWYTCPDRKEVEERTVLAANWQVIGHHHDLLPKQNYLSGCIGHEPWLLTRTEGGTLGAFANVCRHNGTQLVEGSGTAKRLTCPYHGWRYHLDGRLDAAPKCPKSEHFQPESFGLIPLPLHTFGPLILLNADGQATPPDWSRVSARLDATGWGDLKHRERRSYAIHCNWKVFVDNYLDGGYHVPLLHPDLARQLTLKSYQTEVFDDHVIQSAGPSAKATTRLDSPALYVWMYPNLMINRYGPMMDTNVVVPTGPQTCRVDFDWYFAPECTDAFISQSLEASDQVQQEDIQICERLQRGLRSMHTRPGPYVPTLEEGKLRFHQRVHSDVTRADR